MRKTSTWNELLSEAVRSDHCYDSDIIAKAPADEAVWDEPFDAGYGGHQGKPVLAWSETRV